MSHLIHCVIVKETLYSRYVRESSVVVVQDDGRFGTRDIERKDASGVRLMVRPTKETTA